MAHLHRFHISPETPGVGEVALAEHEAHHALHAVRVRVGDEVALFDGQGRELRGAVSRATRHDVFVSVREERREARSPVRLTLIQGWLHREKSVEELIRRGTEIGISVFCFYRAGNSEQRPRLRDKWERTAVESCKQCGRLWLPDFEVASCLEDALQRPWDTLLIAMHALESKPLREVVKGPEVALIIGPEGDLSPEERETARGRGAVPVSLGPTVFRSEAAAILSSALILYELGQLGPQPS